MDASTWVAAVAAVIAIASAAAAFWQAAAAASSARAIREFVSLVVDQADPSDRTRYVLTNHGNVPVTVWLRLAHAGDVWRDQQVTIPPAGGKSLVFIAHRRDWPVDAYLDFRPGHFQLRRPGGPTSAAA